MRDPVIGNAVGAVDIVPAGVGSKVWDDIFPHDFVLARHFKNAPGRAFGPEGEGRLRLCFAAEAETLSKALDRLQTVLD